MIKAMKPYKIEGWAIVTAEEAGVRSSEPDARYIVGYYQGVPIRTSIIVHNGAPHYVETANSVYGLGEPAKVEPPLTPLQNQGKAVVKKALIDSIGASGPSLFTQVEFAKVLLEDSAQATADIVIRALAKAHLLVQ